MPTGVAIVAVPSKSALFFFCFCFSVALYCVQSTRCFDLIHFLPRDTGTSVFSSIRSFWLGRPSNPTPIFEYVSALPFVAPSLARPILDPASGLSRPFCFFTSSGPISRCLLHSLPLSRYRLFSADRGGSLSFLPHLRPCRIAPALPLTNSRLLHCIR